MVGRRILEDSTVYTDFSKAYLGLGEAGYRHEAINPPSGGLRGNATLTDVRTGHPYSGPDWPSTRAYARTT